MPNPVPLVPSAHLSEFGDLTSSAAFNAQTGQDRDHSYVPGFSDMKRARESKVAAFHQGKATMAEVRALDLPVNLRWARNQTKKGEPDNSKAFGHSRNGYRMATKKDVGSVWLKELPAGAQYNADGAIRNGDCVLMVCDAQAAAQNVHRKALDTQTRLTGTTAAYENSIQKLAAEVKVTGVDPSITKDAGSASPTK
jgi:hypothetical protein